MNIELASELGYNIFFASFGTVGYKSLVFIDVWFDIMQQTMKGMIRVLKIM
jgi:hypothetical protein